MAHRIGESCVVCGACEAQCPMDAIAAEDGKVAILPQHCTDCAVCVEVCPTDAIASG